MQKQRYLLLIDETGASASSDLRNKLAASGLPVEVHHVTLESLHQSAWSALLSSQWIGTYLYLLVSWPLLEPLKQLAEDAGFSEQEMECHGLGPRTRQVFCSACQKMNQTEDTTVIMCHFCGEELSVSEHYSKRLQAFLGYTSIR